MEKLVIAGNGIAGHSALQEVLKSGKEFDITVVWEEHPNTYMRTQIIHYAVGELAADKFFMTKGDFYADKGVRSVQGKVTAIDEKNRTVTLASGEEITWDRLILATGAYNFVPPVQVEGHSECQVIDSGSVGCHEGVYTMRNLEDARNFGDKIRTARKAVVVGGGLLGLEAADILAQKGLDVTVVEFAPRLLPRQLDTASSELFKAQAEQFGITFLLGDSVKEIRYDENQLKEVLLNSGRLVPCDLVLFSIGIRSNLESFGKTVDINRGILINKYTETSEPGIYACGDAAEYNGMVYGTWGFAMSSGKAAGQNASGTRTEMKSYVLNTMFNSLGTKIFSTGAVNFDDPLLETHVSGNPKTGYAKLLFQDGILVAGVLMGDTSQGPKLSKAIEGRMNRAEAIEAFRPKAS